MNFQKLRSVLFSAMIAVSLSGPVQAQTVSVNGANCPGATVTLGANTIAINTSNCSAPAPVAPSITSGAPPSGNVGAIYSYQFTATGTLPIAWTMSPSTIAGGLTLSSAGVLNGTPTTSTGSPFAITVTASNGTAPNASVAANVTITNLAAITSAAPPNGTPNVAYTHQFTANQAVTAWSASPTPPAWLGLNPTTGFLSGNPLIANAGAVNFTVSAVTANGTATQVVAFSVIAPILPAFTSGVPTAGVVGTPYSFAFTASGSPAPTFTLVTPNSQPTGLSLSTAGVLSGTPSAAGTFTFAVQASNSAGTAVSPSTGTHSVVIGPAVAQTGAVLADISGNVIPRPVSRAAKAILAPHAGLNGGNTISGQEWRGWAPDPTRCSGTPAITRYWYHNIDILDYGQQNALDYLDFAPNQAATFAFVPGTPAANNSQVGRIFITTGPNATPAPTFVSISTNPCDFDVSKVAAADPCYKTGASENGMTFQITTNATSPVCKLTPGTQYYLNLRFQDARPAPLGSPTVDGCGVALPAGYSTCGALLQVLTY